MVPLSPPLVARTIEIPSTRMKHESGQRDPVVEDHQNVASACWLNTRLDAATLRERDARREARSLRTSARGNDFRAANPGRRKPPTTEPRKKNAHHSLPPEEVARDRTSQSSRDRQGTADP